MNDVELKAYFDKHYSCQNIQLFLKTIEVLAIQVTQRRYQWLPIWYVKNKISSKMKLNAYSNAFLMKRDDVWDYLKWHLLYDYKLKK